MPYNFYLSYTNNEFRLNFDTVLKWLYNLTGKRVTLVAHSMGNLNVLYNVGKMSKEDKDKYISNYIAL